MLFFNDEVNFYFDGLINRKNFLIWCLENLQVLLGEDFWLEVSSDHSYFGYRYIIKPFLVPTLQDMNVNFIWFQQDCAACFRFEI